MVAALDGTLPALLSTHDSLAEFSVGLSLHYMQQLCATCRTDVLPYLIAIVGSGRLWGEQAGVGGIGSRSGRFTAF